MAMGPRSQKTQKVAAMGLSDLDGAPCDLNHTKHSVVTKGKDGSDNV